VNVHDANHHTAQSSSNDHRRREAEQQVFALLDSMREIPQALSELACARGRPGSSGSLERILSRQLMQMINDVRRALADAGFSDIPF
jgi:hypothetical protein